MPRQGGVLIAWYVCDGVGEWVLLFRSGPSMVPVSASQQYRYYNGKRDYYAHYEPHWVTPSVPSDSIDAIQ